MHGSPQLILTKDDGHGFRPPCMRQINDFRGHLYHQFHGLPHPVALVNHAWSKVETALKVLLNKLDDVRRVPRPLSPTQFDDPNVGDLLDAQERFVYEITEFTEGICENLKKSFVPPEKQNSVRIPDIKSLRRHADIICNKLKHEHNRLISIEVTYPFGTAIGYAVCSFHGHDALQLNPFIHSKRQGFSFYLDIRHTLANIYFIGEKIGAFIEGLSESQPGSEKCIPPSDTTIQLLKRVSELPKFTFPDEDTTHMPVFEFDEKILLIKLSGGTVINRTSGYQSLVRYSGDGHTRTFPLVY